MLFLLLASTWAAEPNLEDNGPSAFDRTRLSDLLALTVAPRSPLTQADLRVAEIRWKATVTGDEVRSPKGWTLLGRETDDADLVQYVLTYAPGSKASPLPVDPSLKRVDLTERYARTGLKEDSRYDLFLPAEDGAPWARWTFRNGEFLGLELRLTKPLEGRGPTWSSPLGCVEHDGGECIDGRGLYKFADGTLFRGTFFQNGTLVGKVTQERGTLPGYPGACEPGTSFELEAFDEILEDAACGGCATADRFAASRVTDSNGNVRDPDELLALSVDIEPHEVELLVSQAGWAKSGDLRIPPGGGRALVLNASGRIAGLEERVRDTLPLGLTQTRRSELIERYGPPWEPRAGKLHLVRGSEWVLLTFS